MTGQCYIW